MVIKRGKKIKPKLSNNNLLNNNDEIIVREYIDKLDKSLKEKDLQSFWTFADRSGFKKIKNMSFKDMQTALKEDVKKYANRKLCDITIATYPEPDKYGTYLLVDILVIFTDDEANMKGKNCTTNSCAFLWSIEDFKLTKFSLKLVEAIMHPIADNIHTCTSFTGFHVTKVINDLRKKGVDLSDHIIPLPGL
jgi:hypothetical protein